MAHIRVAWATPIDPAAKGKPLAILAYGQLGVNGA
jgi:hypothetical protein